MRRAHPVEVRKAEALLAYFLTVIVKKRSVVLGGGGCSKKGLLAFSFCSLSLNPFLTVRHAPSLFLAIVSLQSSLFLFTLILFKAQRFFFSSSSFSFAAEMTGDEWSEMVRFSSSLSSVTHLMTILLLLRFHKQAVATLLWNSQKAGDQAKQKKIEKKKRTCMNFSFLLSSWRREAPCSHKFTRKKKSEHVGYAFAQMSAAFRTFCSFPSPRLLSSIAAPSAEQTNRYKHSNSCVRVAVQRTNNCNASSTYTIPAEKSTAALRASISLFSVVVAAALCKAFSSRSLEIHSFCRLPHLLFFFYFSLY